MLKLETKGENWWVEVCSISIEKGHSIIICLMSSLSSSFVSLSLCIFICTMLSRLVNACLYFIVGFKKSILMIFDFIALNQGQCCTRSIFYWLFSYVRLKINQLLHFISSSSSSADYSLKYLISHLVTLFVGCLHSFFFFFFLLYVLQRFNHS